MATACTDAEAGFWAAIEADPAEATHYLVFADWLVDRDDPREQAFRVLGRWRMVPWYFSGSVCWGWWRARTWPSDSKTAPSWLPIDWLSAIPLGRHTSRGGSYNGRSDEFSFDNVHTPDHKPEYGVRVLLKATVAGFLALPPERRAELLERGPMPQEG